MSKLDSACQIRVNCGNTDTRMCPGGCRRLMCQVHAKDVVLNSKNNATQSMCIDCADRVARTPVPDIQPSG